MLTNLIVEKESVNETVKKLASFLKNYKFQYTNPVLEDVNDVKNPILIIGPDWNNTDSLFRLYIYGGCMATIEIINKTQCKCVLMDKKKKYQDKNGLLKEEVYDYGKFLIDEIYRKG